jgi:hypothetical protein
MPKKNTPGKSTTRKSTTGKARTSTSKPRAKSRQTTKTRSAQEPKQAKPVRVTRGESAPPESERRLPREHYRGERGPGIPAVEPGSLEEETLDRDAPYNRTYGR